MIEYIKSRPIPTTKNLITKVHTAIIEIAVNKVLTVVRISLPYNLPTVYKQS